MNRRTSPKIFACEEKALTTIIISRLEFKKNPMGVAMWKIYQASSRALMPLIPAETLPQYM